jgi:hypothetical protein
MRDYKRRAGKDYGRIKRAPAFAWKDTRTLDSHSWDSNWVPLEYESCVLLSLQSAPRPITSLNKS